jgi:hypothetical protein
LFFISLHLSEFINLDKNSFVKIFGIVLNAQFTPLPFLSIEALVQPVASELGSCFKGFTASRTWPLFKVLLIRKAIPIRKLE